MNKPRIVRQNNCTSCPFVGIQGTQKDEYYDLLSLRFNLRIAAEMSRGHDLMKVETSALEHWLRYAEIDVAHLDHIPKNTEPGIMATLPSGCGMPLIDGNHRAARALRDGTVFVVTVLNEEETLNLLCRSMGIYRADLAWQRLASSKPHPNDA